MRVSLALEQAIRRHAVAIDLSNSTLEAAKAKLETLGVTVSLEQLRVVRDRVVEECVASNEGAVPRNESYRKRFLSSETLGTRAHEGGTPLEKSPAFLDFQNRKGRVATAGRQEQARRERPARRPAWAGQAYPADPAKLKATLAEAFAQAEPRKTTGPVFAVVTPHGDYRCSAKVAASAFNQIDVTKKYEHIFLLGTNHYTNYPGISVYTAGDYATPLGAVRSDPLGEELLKNPLFTNEAEHHSREHGLELQLPFLQYLMHDDLSIVPMLLGDQSPETSMQAAEALRPYFNEKNLFIVTTDLSHFADQEATRRVDARMLDAVATNSPREMMLELVEQLEAGTPGLATPMCSWGAVLSLLFMSSDVPGLSATKIDYGDSARALGDTNKVIGFGALAFEVPAKSP